jgi:hypothetical protein
VGRTDITGLTVALQRGATMSGRIEFDGAALPQMANYYAALGITLEPADGKPRANATAARVNPDGTFTTPGVPSGHYLLRAFGSPGGWMFKSAMAGAVDVADTPIELGREDIGGVRIIFTDRVTRLTATVRNASGDSGTAVVVFPADSDGWRLFGVNPRRMRLMRTFTAGDVVFQNLPPGEYYLAAIDDAVAGEWQDPRFLTVLSRQAVRVTLPDGGQVTQQLDRLNIKPPSQPSPDASPRSDSDGAGDSDRPSGPNARRCGSCGCAARRFVDFRESRA